MNRSKGQGWLVSIGGVLLGWGMFSCGQNPPPVPGPTLPDSTPKVHDSSLAPDTGILADEGFWAAADSYDSPDREDWQRPEWVISSLGDLSKSTVADIGAGTGYFSFRLAEVSKQVIAIDIDPRFLSSIEEGKEARARSVFQRIETRLTQADQPGLQAKEADLALIVNTYAYLDNRVGYFRKLLPGLKPGGRLVIVDFKTWKTPVGPGPEDRVALETVRSELSQAGFDQFKVDTTGLPYQYFLECHAPPNP